MAADADRVLFANAGITLPRLGFGCAGLMQVSSARLRRELLASALDIGLAHFDVARMYGLGAAERELGSFVRHRRDSVTIATKFGLEARRGLASVARFQGPARAVLSRLPTARSALRQRSDHFEAPRIYDAASARKSLEKSLGELGVDYVDLFFVHDPRPSDGLAEDELTATFEDLRSEGKIRAWGVSQDAHPSMNVVEQLGDSAVLQIRRDVLQPASPAVAARGSIGFGVLASAHRQITAHLGSVPGAQRRWTEELGVDPLDANNLSALLVSSQVELPGPSAVLFATSVPQHLETARRVLSNPFTSAQLKRFAELSATVAAPARPTTPR